MSIWFLIGVGLLILLAYRFLPKIVRGGKSPIARVKVSRAGQINLNGTQVTREQLRTALASLKDVNGVVGYYREGEADFPSEEAEKVFETILDAGLPLRMSSKPDFSDSIGPDDMLVPSSHTPSDTSPSEVYSTFREQALSIKRTVAGIPAPPPDAPVWGILMETGYPEGTASLFTLSDGTTSLYFSSGGRIIGGHSHENVRQANADFIKTANQFYQQMTSCESFPAPETGRTIFYALTDSGILTEGALEDDLGEERHPLSPLFHAGHAVITQLYRL